ncbi:LEAF RUST 10 DISEASE-RESISTANCE LOCUS RECEPTOR-LIKE PROTEIN KINASE-like 2.7 isoform X2 [Syzygium oleosum]|uniref:LEAF RUST 10 DISEASE-RESISTANCE LOCUS RECEPTOR-LIKE PROTEIN KINASE-like 2.7 isoform X2 n=1 Tax=Syzygium oleosum TaxID=219896 RepID=UPI0024BB1FBD|nr:LEAF RUST 10 DISEASE-RESISTANCE LOCUS RECEPTOR-LIKE PROTEIN KINASE-like 2.7 isoform X2 [Syzygium oleosum]
MPPLPPLRNLILVLLSVAFSAKISVCAMNKHFQNCSIPRTCGGHSITFPFSILHQQSSYCGFPGFELACIDNTPILNVSGNDYVIHDIFYKNQSVRISNSAVSNNSTFSCTPDLKNLTLPSTQFQIDPNITAPLFLLYNCNISSHADYLLGSRITCAGKEGQESVVLAIYGDDEDREVVEASTKCQSAVKALVAAEWRGRRGEIEEVLRSGFVLNWTAPHCSACEESGGKCGFNLERFRCYCPDGAYASVCVRAQQGDLVMKVAIAASGVGIAIVILVVYSIRKKSMIRKHMDLMMGKKEHSSTAQKIEGLFSSRRYTYKDIKRMTNSFREKLGQGGYGYVYKGNLRDGQLVAVKLLKKLKGDGEEFVNEVASISRTSHVNVVSLLGFCFEGSKRALVYEFMPNGSLEKFIFKSNTSEANLQLSWEILYNISLGIAQGLEYLHRGCNARILHFDIKPHNILLDQNYCPKISDFGLAKICPREESIVSMLGARGTAGYIAPELVIRNIGGVSHKSDVYSYGMMVLEMVGGRKNVEVGMDRTSEIYFPHWIHRRLELQEELGLRGIMNEEDEGIAKKMIIISLWCIQIDPRARPSMTQVVEMLKGSVEALQIPPKPTLSTPSSRFVAATTDECSLLQFGVTTTTA